MGLESEGCLSIPYGNIFLDCDTILINGRGCMQKLFVRAYSFAKGRESDQWGYYSSSLYLSTSAIKNSNSFTVMADVLQMCSSLTPVFPCRMNNNV